MNYTAKFFTKLDGKTEDELAREIYESCTEFQPCNVIMLDGSMPLAFNDEHGEGSADFTDTSIYYDSAYSELEIVEEKEF